MFNFIPSTVPHNIFVIGAGGTGSRLIPLLAQFIRSITHGRTPTGWVRDPNIWLLDNDTVEQKNILRQNFIESDVGKAKATILAERYSRAYGVNIIPLVEKVTTANTTALLGKLGSSIEALTGNHTEIDLILDSSIVVMCVDSVEARRDILNTFIGRGTSRKTFIIDAGNEDNFGQVSFFTPTILYEEDVEYDELAEHLKLPKLIPVSSDIDFLPLDLNYYKNLVDTPAQGSCADLNQTLAINAIMATTIIGVIQNYYYRKKMTYNSVSISLDGASFTTHNTFNNFKSKAIPLKEATSYSKSSGTLAYSKEKDGTDKPLNFVRNCQYTKIRILGNGLLQKIKDEEELRAREVKIKEALERAELKAAELIRAQAELENVAPTAPPTEVTSVTPETKKRKEKESTIDIASVTLPVAPPLPVGTVTPAPVLQAVPRAPRRSVVLEPVVVDVPDAWDALVGEGEHEEGEE